MMAVMAGGGEGGEGGGHDDSFFLFDAHNPTHIRAVHTSKLTL